MLLHWWKQGEVRLVVPSSYYYQYCMNGEGKYRPTALTARPKKLVDFRNVRTFWCCIFPGWLRTMQHEIFTVFHFPLSDFPTHHKISDFFPISRLGGDPVRIINSESYFMKDSLKRNWWSCFAEMKM